MKHLLKADLVIFANNTCHHAQLYARNSEPGVPQAIELAKTHFERRRCGHHPDQYPEPLSAHECIHSVVDPKQSGVNKHRYVCAVNDDGVRASLRRIPGVPLIFIRRSVVLMEPMATATAKARSAEERRKFRAEIRMPGGKRKRDEDDDDSGDDKGAVKGGAEGDGTAAAAKPEKKKKKKSGPKGPNPLAVKKKKKPTQPESRPKTEEGAEGIATAGGDDATSEQAKKKRKRKHKSSAVDGENTASTEGGTRTPITNSEE